MDLYPNRFTDLLPLALTGALIGIGQLLASTERLTLRIIIGRAVSSGGLAVAASSIQLWYPGISTSALVGVSAVAASLGTSFLERTAQKFLGIKV